LDSQESKIRKIVLERLGACRVCHRLHQGGDVRIISQKPDVWMMVVECPDCRSRSFVAAVVDEKQADDAKIALRRLAGEQMRDVSLGMTGEELGEDEPEEKAEPLSEADVTTMHEFLETFDGNFKALFTS
jgi:hypothetical protein